jgi:hypothetical protein
VSPARRGRARLARLAAAVVLACAGPARAQDDPGALIERMQAAWAARSIDDYLALWQFDSASRREAEAAFAREAFSAADARVLFERPASFPDAGRMRLMLRTFAATEPRARVEQWGLVVQRLDGGWRIRARESAGRIDGLVHLSLDPAGFRADGKLLRFEDFELRMLRGTLYTTPASLGPTALLFVGEGQLRITPRPPTEREQLRQFLGRGELHERVKQVFVRLHPADLARALQPADLEPDPDAAKRLADAQRFFDEHSGSAFVLESDLPGAPWWVLPSLGDALVVFRSRRGVLSFTASGNQAESISLFDRGRRIQVCLYPGEGRSLRYNEDERRDADALHHDLRVSFEPQKRTLRGDDRLRLRLLRPTASLRLRLKESLRVHSIVSEAGAHLFFRVRNQDSVVVALGPLAMQDDFTLRVVYDGQLDPGALADEAQVPGGERRYLSDEGPFGEEVALYSNRALWYPQPSDNDYAEAVLRLDTPEGYAAVGPGERTQVESAGGRTLTTYELRQPGKYLAVVVGRLAPAAELQSGGLHLSVYATNLRRGDADGVLARAAEILDFYAGVFGPCPYPALNIVLLQGHAPAGHSPPGMIVLTARSRFVRSPLAEDPSNFDEVPWFYLAHELAHQWWGQGVGGQNYRERWLSEGSAQYAAALWVQRAHGNRTFQGVLRRLARWALRHGSRGPINLGFRLGHIQQDPQIYRAVVYDKGAYVLHMLRGMLGDEAFLGALRAFQEQYRYRKAGTDDLREALERASGRDLAAYFDAWVYGTGVPRLRGELHASSAGGAWRARVSVRADDLPGPVPLELTISRGGQALVRRVTLEPGTATFLFDTDFKPARLELNSDNGLLAGVD